MSPGYPGRFSAPVGTKVEGRLRNAQSESRRMEDLFAGTQISRFQFLPHLNARPSPAGRRKTNEETEIPLEPPLKSRRQTVTPELRHRSLPRDFWRLEATKDARFISTSPCPDPAEQEPGPSFSDRGS